MAEGKKVGELAFIIGVVIAIVIGAFTAYVPKDIEGMLILLLIILGLIVGFMNVTEKESTSFLVAAVALLITGTAGDKIGLIPYIGLAVENVVKQIGVFVAPAAIIVALKSIHTLAKD